MITASVSRPSVLSANTARSGSFGTKPVRLCSRTVVRASAQPAKGDSAHVVLKAFGALAAVQLALSGPALADSVQGPPINNQTDGAQTGQTRANYAGLGDIKGPNVPKDALAGGGDLPDTAGLDTLGKIANKAGEKVGGSADQLSKAGDKLSGPGGTLGK